MRGEPLVRRAARIAVEAGVGPARVVIGAAAEAVEAALRGLSVEVIRNDAWEDGLASSLRAGLAGVECTVLVMNCDQPAVGVEHLRALVVAGT